ncbi:MAG: hypothetical protein U9R79_21940 [Armatimonadota bacterium]|nr:hypothetical protein [Armatimonadota bacterium]
MIWRVAALTAVLSGACLYADGDGPVVSIRGEEFLIDGRPTHEGVSFRGHSIQGLLFNSRMVQGIFDDENPETRRLWEYPDTGEWDAGRNTREFVAAMPSWREHGLLAFTVNLQGGGPIYQRPFPYNQYINSAYDPQGHLKPAYMARLASILDRAAELEMAVILGLAYFGVDHRYVGSPQAIRQMADEIVDWLAQRDDRHVLIEIANEATRIRSRTGEVSALELMERIRTRSRERYHDGFTLLCATSLGGGGMHDDQHLRAMDFILVHGNGQSPDDHRRMIREIRASDAFGENPKPIVFNEAHTEIGCLLACAEMHASWGYFDQGTNNYRDGFQTPPVRWEINTEDKRRFFEALGAITRGEEPAWLVSPPHLRGFVGLPEDTPVSGRIEVSLPIDDRWGVDRVEFFIDGERVNVERRHPYYLGGDTGGRPHGYDTSRLEPGEHRLRAVAHSVAGSVSEAETTFIVAAE